MSRPTPLLEMMHLISSNWGNKLVIKNSLNKGPAISLEGGRQGWLAFRDALRWPLYRDLCMPYLLRGQHWEQALDILMFAQRSNLQRKSGTAGAGAGAFFNVEHQLELYNVSISACQKWLGGLGHLNPTMGTPTTGGWVVFPGIPRCLPKYLASGIVFAAVMSFEWFIIKVSAFVGVWRKKRIFRGVMA